MRYRRLVRTVRNAWNRGLIPPEIVDDAFYAAIASIAGDSRVRTILEIGASSGAGSTEALISGARRNPSHPTIHALEVLPARYAALIERHRMVDFFHGYNASSVAVERFSGEQQVSAFYEQVESPLNAEPLPVVLGWLRSEKRTVLEHDLSQDGIRSIKRQAGIDRFDMVLIDGSEFTGSAELDDVYGATFLLLDDIRTFKNFDNYRRLDADPDYVLVEKGEELRNGYAVFERRSPSP